LNIEKLLESIKLREHQTLETPPTKWSLLKFGKRIDQSFALKKSFKRSRHSVAVDF